MATGRIMTWEITPLVAPMPAPTNPHRSVGTRRPCCDALGKRLCDFGDDVVSGHGRRRVNRGSKLYDDRSGRDSASPLRHPAGL